MTSPDVVGGTIVVEDPDGIDSIWVTLQTTRTGTDGFFDRSISVPLRFDIPPNLTPGTILDLRFEARDIAGFRSTLDTTLTVVAGP